MKVTLEQIDELRNRVNVSYEEAKKTLEKNDGDLIKSIIELEKKKEEETKNIMEALQQPQTSFWLLGCLLKTRTEIQF